MAEQYPFQIVNHGDNVFEMIVGDVIKPDHKVAEALAILLNKCDYVILSLKENAVLHESFTDKMAELTASGRLLVVAREDEQIQVSLPENKKFNELQAAQSRVNGERNIEKILKQIEEMPLMQSSANKLLNMLRDPKVTFENIEEVTSKDPKLVMRMLKIANSAVFSRRMPFENLKAVVTYLGLDGIKEIILQETFDGFSQVFANQREKLAHMRRCAHLTTWIGKLIGADINLLSRMNSAGLLHDIGSLALCFYDSQEYARATMMVRNDKKTVCAAEIEVFGVDHQELGMLMAKKIGMPDYLWPAMARHHDPALPSDDLLLVSVITANGYLNQFIENLPFTPYEPYLPTLAEKRRKKEDGGRNLARSAQTSAQNAINSLISGNDGEVFKVPYVYEVLKAELDRFMLAGTEAQGM
ncbi:MAG: HDOD domain-containing protein [Candidatus Riflebacteria bacterium]|nr:HDOD domain-containing protein [Candidatus Riflebacteria bacterium]